MEPEIQKLKQLIDDSQKILVTSHISPDPDAVSSVILMGTTLRLNYPDKQVSMVLEEEPAELNFLVGYDQLQFEPIVDALQTTQPELLIILDGNNFGRVSRHDGEAVRQIVRSSGVRTVAIDHHELDGKDELDVFINNNSPATVQDVYEICFKVLNLKQPQSYAQTTMTGLYADSGGFVYMKAGQHQRLFALAEELVSAGADIEAIKNQLSQFSEADMRALSMLTANVSHQDDYTFSFISDDFIEAWTSSGKSLAQLQKATGTFLDVFVRNIDGRAWGFIVYRNPLQGPHMYSVSLRAAGNAKDVSLIAAKLGGGGHKPAAGAKFKASSVKEAIDSVIQAISG